MNVANLELCRELYELSGWGTQGGLDGRYASNGCPAYDLGYLLRKLPAGAFIAKGKQYRVWMESNKHGDFPEGMDAYDRATPEDAAAKLAIELFKQGVLTK